MPFTEESYLTITACFITGLASTLHCWVMCGGISTMLSYGLDNHVHTEHRFRQSFLLLNYNLGRIISYSAIGLLLGVFSEAGLKTFVSGSGHIFLKYLSSALLILIALKLIDCLKLPAFLFSLFNRLWSGLQQLLQLILPIDSLLKAFTVGLFWGWLPCGMVYSVLLLAIASGDARVSMLCMLAFGLGTLPGMLLAGMASQSFIKRLNIKQMRYVFAFVIVALALYPYVPQLFSDTHSGMHEHHHHHH